MTTIDRSTADLMYYAPEQLGKTRRKTPEGFLLCEGVPIARAGVQLYHPVEIPTVTPDSSGMIRIDREPSEVFRPETMASFEGKAVCIDHPAEFVTPETHKDLAVGHVQNVRRGQGVEDDLLLADLLITDPDAIEHVNRNMPELSAGYDADYVELEPGRGAQRNIVGNHVALVDRGRAGPRVAIRDSDAPLRRFWDRVRQAVRLGDEEAVYELLEVDESEMYDQRLRDAEAAIADMRARWALREARDRAKRARRRAA